MNKVYISKESISACSCSTLRLYIKYAGTEIKSDTFYPKLSLNQRVQENKRIYFKQVKKRSTIANSDQVDILHIQHGRWKSYDSNNMFVVDFVAKNLRKTEVVSM